MLRLKSFDFTQEAEMNALLDKHILASGAHVFVSDGKIILPIEDGLPKTNAQRIVEIQEQKNIIADKLDIIIHSQRVLDLNMADAKVRINEAKANLAEAESKKGKDKFDAVKECTEILKNLERSLADLNGQYIKNKVEVIHQEMNLRVYDERIAELQK
jgi:hypothetical protein